MPRLTTKIFNAKLNSLHHAIVDDFRSVLRLELETASQILRLSIDQGMLESQGGRTGIVSGQWSTQVDAPVFVTKTVCETKSTVAQEHKLTDRTESSMQSFIEESESEEQEEKGPNNTWPQQFKNDFTEVEGTKSTLAARRPTAENNSKPKVIDNIWPIVHAKPTSTEQEFLVGEEEPIMLESTTPESLQCSALEVDSNGSKSLKLVTFAEETGGVDSSAEWPPARISTASVDSRIISSVASCENDTRHFGTKCVKISTREEVFSPIVGSCIKPVPVGKSCPKECQIKESSDTESEKGLLSGEEDATFPRRLQRPTSLKDNAEAVTSFRAHGSSIAQLETSYRRFKLLQPWVDLKKNFTEEMRLQRLDSSVPQQHNTRSQRSQTVSYTMRLDELLRPHVFDPHSTARTVWSLLSLFLVLYETFMVPLELTIGIQPSPFTMTMKWLCAIIWTIDIPFNFITGYIGDKGLEQRPSRIWFNYLRTWLAFDVMLVFSDWFFLSTEDNTSAYPVIRATRILRMLRLARIAKVHHVVSDFLAVAPDFVAGCAAPLRISIVMCIFIHICSCVWFAIGSLDRGWATRPDVKSDSSALKYQHSLYWMITRMHGGTMDEPSAALEFIFAVIMQCCGFIFLAIFVGKTAHAATSLDDARKQQLRQVCRKYWRTRGISSKLQFRLNKYLSKSQRTTLKQQVDLETEMLQALPGQFLMDLHAEIRSPLLLLVPFFCEMHQRMLRMLCHEAVSGLVAMAKEFVFQNDVLCTRMLWVESGSSAYVHQLNKGGLSSEPLAPHRYRRESANQTDKLGFLRDFDHNGQNDKSDFERDIAVVTRGSFLSEAALWTEWFHCGDLVAESDSTLLALEVTKFLLVVPKMEHCLSLTLSYAHCYITELNKYCLYESDTLSDILNLSEDSSIISSLRQPLDDRACYEHLVFLSHFKQEAGTEASLMESALNKIILEDPSHPASIFTTPCFLDSEGLADLRGLTDHVSNCHNLILLLTPHVLDRPWCLIEIVTAVRHGVNLVPVEIQRPGLGFEFPGDDFYEALGRGKTLSKGAIDLLRNEGVELEELEECLRQVFAKIALPFSPHKSVAIRNAELMDILSRCVISTDSPEPPRARRTVQA